MVPDMENEVNHKPGDVIIQEGDVGNGFYILKMGTLGVFRGDVEVGRIETPETIFGEMSDILGEPRTCSVIAQSDCAVVFHPEGVVNVIEKKPNLIRMLIKDLAERLRDTTDRLARVETEKNMVWCFERPIDDEDEQGGIV